MVMTQRTRVCVYCSGVRAAKLTREHIISKTVLEAVFGLDIRCLSRSTAAGDRMLIDEEHVIKDVCGKCNSDLSVYDEAGRDFITVIHGRLDAHGGPLPCHSE